MSFSPTPTTAAMRVLYVEDDPALRNLLAQLLRAHDSIHDVTEVANAREALEALENGGVDAALIDVSLGRSHVSGFELGLALRSIARYLPIVMFSQHPTPRMEEVLPEAQRYKWSYVQKRGEINVGELVDTVQQTAKGFVRFDGSMARSRSTPAGVLSQLSPRQREVMALASTGIDARAIAEKLHLAHVSVRRELSRAYRVLVPNSPAGTDLRTAAVLEYLRLSEGVVGAENV